MLKKIARLFVIKSRFDAMVIIYALALGAIARGEQYLYEYPGFGGYLLFAACTGAVFMAGAKLMEATRPGAGSKSKEMLRPSPLRTSGAGPRISAAPPARRVRPAGRAYGGAAGRRQALRRYWNSR